MTFFPCELNYKRFVCRCALLRWERVTFLSAVSCSSKKYIYVLIEHERLCLFCCSVKWLFTKQIEDDTKTCTIHSKRTPRLFLFLGLWHIQKKLQATGCLLKLQFTDVLLQTNCIVSRAQHSSHIFLRFFHNYDLYVAGLYLNSLSPKNS